MTRFEVENEHVVIAGGSRGLGKSLAIELAKRGANVLLLARGQAGLDSAKEEVLLSRKSESQVVDVRAVDLCDAEAVKTTISNHPTIPSILICVAGGSSPSQIGFISSLTPAGFTSCLEINYYTSLFITQSLLRLWINNPSSSTTRHVVFINSAAAFVALPGYAAYTAAKVAQRALADTLRGEVLLYGGKDRYQVHSAFPGPFITDSFLAEQASKPELTKIMEGSNYPDEEVLKKTPSAEQMAGIILRGLDKGDINITTDLDGRIVLNNMRGVSPRDNFLWDLVLAVVAFFVWPFVRWGWEGKTREFGRKEYGA